MNRKMNYTALVKPEPDNDFVNPVPVNTDFKNSDTSNSVVKWFDSVVRMLSTLIWR
jgi:hypothetical protein